MGELIENFMLIWWLNGSIICEVDKEAERWKGKGNQQVMVRASHEFLLSRNRLPDCCNRLPVAKFF